MSSPAINPSQSETRAEINRANAQHSTGPKTAAGKAISSRNAATHGLTSSRVYLRNDEERSAFAVFESALEKEILPNPDSVLESFHFDRLVAAAWNIDRCDRIQAELAVTSTTDPLLDPAHAKTFQNIELYRRRNERSYLMAAKQIRELQSEKLFRGLALSADNNASENPPIGVLTSLKTVREQYAEDEDNTSRRQASQVARTGSSPEGRKAVLAARAAREAKVDAIVAAVNAGEDPNDILERSNPDEFFGLFPELDTDDDGILMVWDNPEQSVVDWFTNRAKIAA